MCPVSSVCLAYFEFCLFVLMAWICFLCWTLNIRPICPTYFSGRSLYFSRKFPLLLFLSVFSLAFNFKVTPLLILTKTKGSRDIG
jgi:hypothetical protein